MKSFTFHTLIASLLLVFASSAFAQTADSETFESLEEVKMTVSQLNAAFGAPDVALTYMSETEVRETEGKFALFGAVVGAVGGAIVGGVSAAFIGNTDSTGIVGGAVAGATVGAIYGSGAGLVMGAGMAAAGGVATIASMQ